jgi:antagonist of KipI
MDPVALRVGNRLVCNDRDAAGLEMTITGARVDFEDDALIALCGADMGAQIADVSIPPWRAVYVQQGSILSIGRARWGCRAYLAVAGGIDVPEVLESRSTQLRAGLGGFHGRALRAGDKLPIGAASERAARLMRSTSGAIGPLPFALSEATLDPAGLYREGPIRFLPGPDWGLLDESDRSTWITTRYTVSDKSDRMGYRLQGSLLRSIGRGERISTAVVTGTVQVPPGGEPIVLMVDRQTTGGYPMVAQVISADLPSLAQKRPGEEISFEIISLDDARRELGQQHEMIANRGGSRDASHRP